MEERQEVQLVTEREQDWQGLVQEMQPPLTWNLVVSEQEVQ